MERRGCLISMFIPIVLLTITIFLVSCEIGDSHSDTNSENGVANSEQTIASSESNALSKEETSEPEESPSSTMTEIDLAENQTSAEETETDSTENQTTAEETAVDSAENQTTAEETAADSAENQTTAEETAADSAETQTAAEGTESIPTEDTTSEPSITLVSITSPISINKTATLTVKGLPNAEHGINVYYSSGASSAAGLEKKISDDSGLVSWSWKIGARVKSGTYRIVVNCGELEYTTYFVVQ
jgi:cytoskeletal protein RodZ